MAVRMQYVHKLDNKPDKYWQQTGMQPFQQQELNGLRTDSQPA